VPLVLPDVGLAVGLVPILTALEQPLGLSFLAGLHPFWDHVGEPALANHLQNVLAVKLAIHQYVIDVGELFSRIEQVLDDLLA